jgi:hypothetical protein
MSPPVSFLPLSFMLTYRYLSRDHWAFTIIAGSGKPTDEVSAGVQVLAIQMAGVIPGNHLRHSQK